MSTTAASQAIVHAPAPTGVFGYARRVATSSLGAKIVMATTGLIFLLWLCGHLAGNLAMFGGSDKMNAYAHFLKGNPAILWGQRVVMLCVAGLHILSGLRLWLLNRAARPQPYAKKSWRKASFASRTMAVTGIVVLFFLVFHLAHFTWHWVFPEFAPDAAGALDSTGRHDVYRMVATSFGLAPVAFLYAFAVALVGLHVSHGFWSAFHSLGIWGRRWTPFATKAALAVAIGIGCGFAAVPLGILFGLAR